MTTPALILSLSDARQHRAALADRRWLASLSDARQHRAALAEAPLPEPGVGGILNYPGRVPMLTASGTPPRRTPVGGPWQVASASAGASPIRIAAAVYVGATPAVYTPGPDHVPPVGGPDLVDWLRVTDSVSDHIDVGVYFRDGKTIPAQALEVAIGTDGVAALYSGGELALAATGGTGPYVWDIVTNRSGCTLTPEGAYVAGPDIGIDRIRVTDSLGEIGLVQAEVLPGQVAAIFGPYSDATMNNGGWGHLCIPYAHVLPGAGTAPYTVSVLTDATGGAAVTQAKSSRVAVRLQDQAGAALDMTGWTFDARLYSQRGGVMAADLVVYVTGGLLEVELPDPSTLPLTPAVVRVEAETAGLFYALGYPTTAIEVLLLAEET